MQELPSRGHSVVLCVERCGGVNCLLAGGRTLHVLCVGADHEEVTRREPQKLDDHFQQCWSHVTQEVLRESRELSSFEITVDVVGPNLDARLSECVHARDNVEYRFWPKYLHQVPLVLLQRAHLVLCFNAGIWGYDSWRAAVEALLRESSAPVLVTAYSLEEAEDDEDVIAEWASALPSKWIHWKWRAERSPAADSKARITHDKENCTDAERAENLAWLCFHGRCASNDGEERHCDADSSIPAALRHLGSLSSSDKLLEEKQEYPNGSLPAENTRWLHGA